ncbi:MAG: hypothetical protein ACI9LY_000101 [Arenicella sp.]|jgi:hypothetical protein
MLMPITDLPDNVLGIEASGKVTAEDYQTVLVPELEDKLRKIKKVRLFYVLGSAFDSYTGAAAWQDAKVGLTHLTQFDRIAVVTDVDWIRNSVKVFGFAMPGEVRIFAIGALHEAREWVSEPPSTGDLGFEFLEEQGILILQPHGHLNTADFQRIAGEIDPYIESEGELKGVIIEAENFPGWDNLSAFVAHFRFIKNHRNNVKRLAVVSDDKVMAALPLIAKRFVVQEFRHFPITKKTEALAWVSQT